MKVSRLKRINGKEKGKNYLEAAHSGPIQVIGIHHRNCGRQPLSELETREQGRGADEHATEAMKIAGVTLTCQPGSETTEPLAEVIQTITKVTISSSTEDTLAR